MSGIPPVPLFGPVTLNTSEALREAKGGLVKSAPYLAAGIALANADEILEIVEDLLADALRTLTVTSQQELCSALRAWGRDLEHLAEVILSPVADAGADLVQMLVIEVLRIKFSRLASMMSLAGAIVDNPHVGAHFDFEKLRDFMLATPDLVDESFWDELFGEGDESSRMLALLVATLIVAPETLAALNTGDLKIAPLESPPTATTGSPQWRALRERSSGWIPITLPLSIDDQGKRNVSSGPDLRGGFDPDLALSLLFRSQRRPVGRSHRDGFRDLAAPERRCRELRGSHLERLPRPGRAGRAARARLRRQQRNVECRDRATSGIAGVCDDERGDGADRAGHEGRRARHRASGLRTTRASSPATSAPSCICANWASRAWRRSGRSKGSAW